MHQRFFNVLIAHSSHVGTSHDDIVVFVSHVRYHHPKSLFDASSDFVAHNRFADFFANDNTYFERVFGGRIDEYQLSVGNACPLAVKIVEYPSAGQPVLLLHIRLCGQLASTLIATSLEHVSTALRAHSLSKTVHLATLSLFWLKSSFHICILAYYNIVNKIFANKV